MARTKLQTPNFNMTPRADGYYEIRYTEAGERKKASTGTKDPVKAETFRARFVQTYLKPKLSEHPTIAEVCDAYMAYRMPLIAAPQALPYAYTPLKRLIGAIYADDMTQTVASNYGKWRAAERPERSAQSHRGDTPVKEATISKELKQLRAALNWAESEKLITRKPNFRIELSNGSVRERWITKAEANALMDEFAQGKLTKHLALFILVALGTAKRREAILSLTWNRVQLHMQGYESINFGDDIGNKRRGTTPIAGNARLIAALKAAKETAKSEFVIEYAGRRIQGVETGLINACKKIGIEPIGAHTLKHSCVTWMVQSGVSFERISKFANTSKDIIERVYGHHSPEFLAETSAAVSF